MLCCCRSRSRSRCHSGGGGDVWAGVDGCGWARNRFQCSSCASATRPRKPRLHQPRSMCFRNFGSATKSSSASAASPQKPCFRNYASAKPPLFSNYASEAEIICSLEQQTNPLQQPTGGAKTLHGAGGVGWGVFAFRRGSPEIICQHLSLLGNLTHCSWRDAPVQNLG